MPPGPDALPSAWLAFRSQKLLRLLPGDEGYVAWCQAKLAFLGSVSVAVREAQELFVEDHDDDPANGDAVTGQAPYLAPANYPAEALLEMLLADFPVAPEEI